MEGLAITGPVSAADVMQLCVEARAAVVRDGSRTVDCDVRALEHPDATTVDAIARIQLTLKRLGAGLRVRGAGPELLDLLDLAGLSQLVPGCSRSGVEPGREPEQGEHPCGVEEEADAGDPVVPDIDDL